MCLLCVYLVFALLPPRGEATSLEVYVFFDIRSSYERYVLFLRLPFGTIKIEMKYQKTKNNIKNKRKKKDDVSQLHW